MESILDFILQHREAIFIVILSIFLGIEVISHVPAILHTPLMSGANAIHGVVIIGARHSGISVRSWRFRASTPACQAGGFRAIKSRNFLAIQINPSRFKLVR